MFKRYLSGCVLAGICAAIFGCPPLAGAKGVEGIDGNASPGQSGFDGFAISSVGATCL